MRFFCKFCPFCPDGINHRKVGVQELYSDIKSHITSGFRHKIYDQAESLSLKNLNNSEVTLWTEKTAPWDAKV